MQKTLNSRDLDELKKRSKWQNSRNINSKYENELQVRRKNIDVKQPQRLRNNKKFKKQSWRVEFGSKRF